MNVVVREREEKESTKRDLYAVPSIIHLACFLENVVVVVATPAKAPFLRFMLSRRHRRRRLRLFLSLIYVTMTKIRKATNTTQSYFYDYNMNELKTSCGTCK